ncbi:hypothetical protein Q4601_13365 [Shewanella sp. 1_MG-2023]|uniref:FAD/FMN-containing dehydrogenase n=1 Tax=Shewanella electrodiphila TaxID=934143 RepID=A0ABT0KV74_9GAMM|nr:MULTISPECIES: hypothetical protein [Shewanella]MCC4834758.1 hypothetical protein [Shewanella sp. 10N.7]MCL1047742.1 hypothetical protein [Shewanella electrodiphila]MDO6612615.1 hypothetical protein [Shewanella sp. 7_MG-2023]MDO6772314.1 hypothetical protein [Shewanella sp. 2_MG-2023]MDO6795297.1 hypothetical protein [Shewanella sp. 1_MG-2023]
MKAILFVVSLFFMTTAQANVFAVNDKIEPVTLEDQFEQPLVINEQTQVVLFSRGMKGGEFIQEALEAIPAEKKPENLAYIADISGMPSLIARFVAIPKMKDLPFSMGLDREGEVTASWPAEKDMATVIVLDKFTVVSIENFDSSDAIVEAISKQ